MSIIPYTGQVPKEIDPLTPYIIEQTAKKVVYLIPVEMFNGFDWKTAREFFWSVEWQFNGDFPRNIESVRITCLYR